MQLRDAFPAVTRVGRNLHGRFNDDLYNVEYLNYYYNDSKNHNYVSWMTFARWLPSNFSSLICSTVYANIIQPVAKIKARDLIICLGVKPPEVHQHFVGTVHLVFESNNLHEQL